MGFGSLVKRPVCWVFSSFPCPHPALTKLANHVEYFILSATRLADRADVVILKLFCSDAPCSLSASFRFRMQTHSPVLTLFAGRRAESIAALIACLLRRGAAVCRLGKLGRRAGRHHAAAFF